MIFIPLFFVSLFLIPEGDISYIKIVLALFLGLLSHTVLDSFTPAGIKIFAPVSSKKVYRSFGLAMVFILCIVSLMIHVPVLFNLFEDYVMLLGLIF